MTDAAAAQPVNPGLPPGYEIRKKKPFYKRVWFWLLVIVVAIIVAVVAAVGKAADDAVNNSHDVVYKVGGVGKADITFTTSDGSGKSESESVEDVKIPWTKSFTIKGDFSGFSVTATSVSSTKAVTLTCEITVDGKSVGTDKSTGKLAAASCLGTGYDGN